MMMSRSAILYWMVKEALSESRLRRPEKDKGMSYANPFGGKNDPDRGTANAKA